METVVLDRRGRMTIPKKLREALGLAGDDRLLLEVEGRELRLKPLAGRGLKAKARRRWGREAFPRSRDALLADGE